MAKILYSVPVYANDWLINVMCPNPKRPGTDCWLRFEAFIGSVTVADFAKACGKGYRSEIKWCVERGFITLTDPSEVDAEAALDDAERVDAAVEYMVEAEAALAAEAEAVDAE